MFRSRLENQIDLRHPLAQLSQRMPWAALEQALLPRLPAAGGRPALPVRLIAGLLYFKHAYVLSDEAVCERWLENPCWQFFTGEVGFQTRLPCDSSSLKRCTVLGRVVRNLQRKRDQVNSGERERIAGWLQRAQQVQAQRPKDKRKLDACAGSRFCVPGSGRWDGHP
ncbi:IS1478 transposase [Xanthomonas fragariae LMG 25863]|nr:IS1478 transposase [Xanthomonas fragariae LMG 25863]